RGSPPGCGEQLPAAPGLTTRLGNRWRRRFGWYPGDWVWPALLALLLAIAAGALSAIFLADESSSANDTIVRTQERPTTLQETQTAPEPTTTVPTTPATTPPTSKPPPPPAPPKAR